MADAAVERAALEELPFLIVGTGRCGTGSAAAALNALGVRCGHENVFTPEGLLAPNGLQGDASWLALPHLHRFKGRIVHLVREPVATAQSFLDLSFFDAGFENRFTRFARPYVPLTGRPVDDAFRWWVAWNRGCEGFAHVRYRLDQLDELARDVVRRVAEAEPAEGPVRAAVADRHNTKPRSKARRWSAGYEAISSGRLRDAVAEMARRYGFEAP